MTETTAPDLRALRELAEAATPGPWWRAGSSIETDHECSPSHGCWPVADTWPGTKPDGTKRDNAIVKADAAFIAAANPTAVLALLDRLAAAEAAVERVRALADLLAATPPITKPPGFYAEGIRAALDGDQ